MATVNKDFIVKNGIVVSGTTATVNGNQVLTEASSINALNDVTVTSATTGQVLKYNGTAWVNDTDATGGGGGGLTVSDTAPGSPTSGDLWFNSLTGRTYLYYDGYWIEWDTYQVGIVTATGATINTFNAIEISGQGTIVADSSADTLTLVAGTFVSITTNTATDAITINASRGNSFTTISVSGQGNVVADSIEDTLTFVAGSNITITTDTASDSITIAASGGGGETLSPFLLMGA